MPNGRSATPEYHDLSSDDLRDLAPTIPFDLVKQVLFNRERRRARRPVRGVRPQRPRARGDDQPHRVSSAGMDEIIARGADLPTLKNVLSDL